MKSRLIKLYNLVKSFFPTALPVGMAEFKAWQDSILSLSKVPDNDSTRFATAVMIMHLNPTEDHKPMRYFVKALNKSAANECANFIALQLKEKQAKAAKEAAEAKLVGDIKGSNINSGAPNGPMEQNG